MQNRCNSSWRTPEQGRVQRERSSSFVTAPSICGVPVLAGFARSSVQ